MVQSVNHLISTGFQVLKLSDVGQVGLSADLVTMDPRIFGSAPLRL